MAVITISRQFGAGAITLGKMIAARIGYAFIDEEIIQMVAKQAKVSTDWVESIEKEAGGKLLKFISSLVPKGLVDRILDESRGYIDEEIYTDLLYDIITKIADEGNAIIIGRGGQYILKGHAGVYHILLVADKNHRIKFIEEQYKLSHRSAAQFVNVQDKRRINLYRKFHKIDYDQPSHYHLVLNMSLLKIEQAADIVLKLVGDAET